MMQTINLQTPRGKGAWPQKRILQKQQWNLQHIIFLSSAAQYSEQTDALVSSLLVLGKKHSTLLGC